VAVANGDRIASSGRCTDLDIDIADESFVICYYGLVLGSFNMVLGVQWLESLGLVLWDFGFVRNDRSILWSASASLGVPATLAPTSCNMLQELSQQFVGLFIEPSVLPPPRQHSHWIQLLPETEPVAVRPYRYAHTQKEELERQSTDMLRLGIIRSSTSAFSAPVILVKK
jgi:hypothetical protein